jgi:hypothetical protein
LSFGNTCHEMLKLLDSYTEALLDMKFWHEAAWMKEPEPIYRDLDDNLMKGGSFHFFVNKFFSPSGSGRRDASSEYLVSTSEGVEKYLHWSLIAEYINHALFRSVELDEEEHERLAGYLKTIQKLHSEEVTELSKRVRPPVQWEAMEDPEYGLRLLKKCKSEFLHHFHPFFPSGLMMPDSFDFFFCRL